MRSLKNLKNVITSSRAVEEKPLPPPPSNGHEEVTITLPPRPEMSDSPPRIIVIGAGSRGCNYAEAVESSCNGVLAAVAEPHEYKRKRFGHTWLWGADGTPAEGTEFADWKDFISYERERRERIAKGEEGVPPGVDAAFVCVLDEMHREVVIGLCELGGLHIMCEKPLATNMDDCMQMYSALQKNEGKVFSIGHVMRYSPHNMILRKMLLEDRIIGDILSVVHTEPVGWWHFSHSYVRGNWRREDTTAPSLLTKSCHDIDVLLWLLCSPPSYSDANAVPHLPSTVSSSGALQYFKKSRKPTAAGVATNCLSCPIEKDCKYSAKRIYVDKQLRGLCSGNTGWPVKIVVPDIEDCNSLAEAKGVLLDKLKEDYDENTPDSEVAKQPWFGRCVYESDNDVCDDQFVTITWDEDPLPSSDPNSAPSPAADPMAGRGAKQATFHMVAHTEKICDRYTHVYGVDGEVYADSRTITIKDFHTGQTTTHTPRMESRGHGGGDVSLTRQFVLAVDKVKNHGLDADKAQREIIGCTVEEVVRSHAIVFCAEEARTGKKVLDWKQWWESKAKGL